MSGASPPASAPVTRASAVKILASVVVVAGAVAYLLTSSMKQGAEYYKHVDEVMANADAWHGKRLQVHGNVVDGSIEQAKGTLLYRFKIESRPPRAPAVITATYNGLVPDTFKGGAEVVAKGTLTPRQPAGRRSRRHHGQVPVQVRRRQGRPAGAHLAGRRAEALSAPSLQV